MPSAADIEAIERATLQAVAPEVVETLPGWLLPMDGGTVGRAQSAVPLQHSRPDARVLDAVLERYAVRGFAPVFRLPDLPAFEDFRQALLRRGFLREQPTLTQTAPIDSLLAPQPDLAATLADVPDPAWMAMFLGEGLDRGRGEPRTVPGAGHGDAVCEPARWR